MVDQKKMSAAFSLLADLFNEFHLFVEKITQLEDKHNITFNEVNSQYDITNNKIIEELTTSLSPEKLGYLLQVSVGLGKMKSNFQNYLAYDKTDRESFMNDLKALMDRLNLVAEELNKK